jgi:zinc transporter ZupT
MKKFFISISLLLIITNISAQQTDSLPTLTRGDYLKKSKKQKTGAWLLAGTGGVILLGTLVSSGVASISNSPPPFPIVLVLLGSASIVGSISLFKASTRNRRKANDVSVEFIMQRVTKDQMAGLRDRSIPALSFRIRL